MLTLFWVTTSQTHEDKFVTVFLIKQLVGYSPEWPINRGLEGWLRRSRQFLEPSGKEYYFFHNQQGCHMFCTNLEILFSPSFAMQDSFFYIFFLHNFPPVFGAGAPPPPFTFLMVHPSRAANYSVSLPQSVGMRSHRLGAVWSHHLHKGGAFQRAHYPLNHYHKKQDNSYFLAALAHSFTSNQLSIQS